MFYADELPRKHIDEPPLFWLGLHREQKQTLKDISNKCLTALSQPKINRLILRLVHEWYLIWISRGNERIPNATRYLWRIACAGFSASIEFSAFIWFYEVLKFSKKRFFSKRKEFWQVHMFHSECLQSINNCCEKNDNGTQTLFTNACLYVRKIKKSKSKVTLFTFTFLCDFHTGKLIPVDVMIDLAKIRKVCT